MDKSGDGIGTSGFRPHKIRPAVRMNKKQPTYNPLIYKAREDQIKNRNILVDYFIFDIDNK